MSRVLTDGDALARSCAAAMFSRDRAAQSLGIVIDEVRAGYARLSLTIGETMINGHAIAHGGVTFTLADTAFAYACNSRNEANVALSATISFIAAARLGEQLVAVCRQRAGNKGRTGVYDCDVTRGVDGELLATFRGLSYRVKGTVLDGAGSG